MDELCINPCPKLNSERTSTKTKPKFPRLVWRKKKEKQILINQEFVITRVGGFHEKQ